jgi:hypothetical protein
MRIKAAKVSYLLRLRCASGLVVLLQLPSLPSSGQRLKTLSEEVAMLS